MIRFIFMLGVLCTLPAQGVISDKLRQEVMDLLRGPEHHLSVSQTEVVEFVTAGLGGFDLSTIESVHITDVRDLPENFFEGMVNLKHVSLRVPSGMALSERIFHGLALLKELQLDGEHFKECIKGGLRSLPEGIFQGLVRLETLYLRSNELTDLPQNIFYGLESLERLDLSYNKLTDLPPNILCGLKSLKRIFLDGNPL